MVEAGATQLGGVKEEGLRVVDGQGEDQVKVRLNVFVWCCAGATELQEGPATEAELGGD